MCHGENSKLFCSDLIDDAIRESAEDISSARATKHATQQRIAQNKIGCSFKLCYERETKFCIRLQRIEHGRIV
jgi:hypothetical protein